MSCFNSTDQQIPSIAFPPEIQANPAIGIRQFFNGDSLHKVRADLENLRNTTITESYGDLDKEDKWLLVDFLRRIGILIELAHLINSKEPSN
ncbi:hypothetical protein [Pseudobacter ginsenosidimutans]|uniref:Uncharacterized protein n=1 Tax=Pseudobacter ginsenosidimutans TaxID=661488 RepID=A0A4V2F250_9BACT|nr:hypothetical protein [Pseudobacter ginsenosidimutans]QEC44569.1 hypothetical protein FSB84_23895 [Pseudobacter ginsenosidimutans]RZS76047.1 hypothetical protein EV199_1924 [Pseudobacter ginsenosidimutans]